MDDREPSQHVPSQTLRVIDSHTAGEPTRVLIQGLPLLDPLPVAQQLEKLQRYNDWIRTSLIFEPRGSDVFVGAALVPTIQPDCVTGVIFFNNVGYLNMCGHGTIGVVATLAHLGRIQPGIHQLETPVGVVQTTLHADHSVTVQNVLSYRYRRAVSLDVPGEGLVVGDIAWGGNWFFLISDHSLSIEPANIIRLKKFTQHVRDALDDQCICGDQGAPIDHIELVTEAGDDRADFVNFVLCPGMEYDRSPCGTGTSAKLACLAADNRWDEQTPLRVQGISGEIFQGTYVTQDERILPSITGRAFVTADCQIHLNPDDPFRFGIDNNAASLDRLGSS